MLWKIIGGQSRAMQFNPEELEGNSRLLYEGECPSCGESSIVWKDKAGINRGCTNCGSIWLFNPNGSSYLRTSLTEVSKWG